MVDELQRKIFKAGSRTYFYSSLFFPRGVKEEVFTLYAFVRKADNFVDCVSQDSEGFYRFRNEYEKALLGGKKSEDPIIGDFAELVRRKGFDPQWVEAFLHSMEMDLFKQSYRDLSELEEYIYGSAEVIGLMMAKILELDRAAYSYARFQGKAMQLINIIRDINQDLSLGRVYLPQDEIKQYGLDALDYPAVSKQGAAFEEFIRKQLRRFADWQAEAEKGYRYLTRRYRVPVKTAADMYRWTARQIEKDPFIVYRKIVKPSCWRILSGVLLNWL
jgi:phytoene synthase